MDFSNQIWFIPHHTIVNPQKSKPRVVLNCSAEYKGLLSKLFAKCIASLLHYYKGLSLNNCLMQGPDLENSLAAVLTCFHKNKTTIVLEMAVMF